MARERNRNGGGTSGDSGAPAETPAPDAQLAPPADAPQDIPPDAQTPVAIHIAADVTIDVATIDSDTLKRMWLDQSTAIDAAEKALKREQDKRISISTILANRARAARKAATGSEKGAKISIDGRNYRPRKREAKDGDGFELALIDGSPADV